MNKKLKKIFNHYNKKYKLKYRLSIRKFMIGGGGGTCDWGCKRIDINCKETIVFYKLENLRYSNLIEKIGFDKLPVFTLLHELKHAIEHEKNSKQYHKNYVAYKGAYLNNPLEIEADSFAEKELSRWI